MPEPFTHSHPDQPTWPRPEDFEIGPPPEGMGAGISLTCPTPYCTWTGAVAGQRVRLRDALRTAAIHLDDLRRVNR